MKKIISFEKNVDFPSMISEITSISLNHNLKFTDDSSIEGKIIVSGNYKMTEASTIEEEFKYSLPVDIILTEKLEEDTKTISINDFNYQIVNDDTLKCDIDLLITGVEKLDDVRECDGDLKIEETEKEEVLEEKKEEVVEEKKEEVVEEESSETLDNTEVEEKEEKKHISSIFANLPSTDESFSTYSVYIFRKEDTLEKIMEKYSINTDILSEYNDLSDIKIGTKLIIPNTSNE